MGGSVDHDVSINLTISVYMVIPVVIPVSSVVIKNLTVSQLAKDFRTFCGPLKFIIYTTFYIPCIIIQLLYLKPAETQLYYKFQ
jgi:hypothetical protein